MILDKNNVTCEVGEKVDDELTDEMLAFFKCCVPCPTPPKDYPDWEVGIKLTVATLTVLVGVVGNVLVIVTVVLCRRLHTTTNVFLLNLAASDVMVCACCVWVHAVNHIQNDWPFGSFLCHVNVFLQGK